MDVPQRLMVLEPNERIVVALQRRRINFASPETPEITVASHQVLATFEDPQALLHFFESWPAERTANFQWWAVAFTEACSHCGQRFDTYVLHWALAVTIEVEPNDGEGLVACWYPERFCGACQSQGAGLGIRH